MKTDVATGKAILDELHEKLMLTDMKSKIVNIICSLIDDQLYSKDDAVYALLNLVILIELEEKKVRLNELQAKLIN